MHKDRMSCDLESIQNLGISPEATMIDKSHSIENIHKKQKILKSVVYSIFLTMLVSIILVGSGILFLNRVTIDSVEISGDITLPSDIVNQRLEITFPSPYFDVDINQIAVNFMDYPLIYHADVRKSVFGVLYIDLERSNPIVSILSTQNDIQEPAYFDENGRCVQVGTRIGIADVPILSGVTLVDPFVGVFLPDWIQVLLQDLSRIQKEDMLLYKRVSEINIQDKGQEYRVLEIFFIGANTSFITDINITTNSLSQLWIFAEKVSSSKKLQEFEYFDVRQGVIIGKKKAEVL